MEKPPCFILLLQAIFIDIKYIEIIIYGCRDLSNNAFTGQVLDDLHDLLPNLKHV